MSTVQVTSGNLGTLDLPPACADGKQTVIGATLAKTIAAPEQVMPSPIAETLTCLWFHPQTGSAKLAARVAAA